MAQLFDPASHTFWRNVKERAVAPVTAFGRNPVRWNNWEPQMVPPVPAWYVSQLRYTCRRTCGLQVLIRQYSMESRAQPLDLKEQDHAESCA